ncbi:dynamin family protein [Streptomyces hesseae]|uniref:Dynamin family protein n=1 Tax=Streptomyces hesseae TaxID=3075519 RepID=A0ABU2SPE5_9ACTN|nr:dynamin family protein [Streptomyces sp. DSM 40473]MDT0450760.1 dynamin family protein [Streptomyces sp. DSM 40473]
MDETRGELRDVLDRSEAWLRDAARLPEVPAEWPEELRAEAATVRRLRTRAASTLINVALLGAFSSGKSFLLSGLQGGLELVEVQTPDGLTADKFVGLLPSSPVPTTACPATVVPVDGRQSAVDASGTGYLRVRFTDSADGEWQDVGNSPAPSVVAAYAMQDADVTNRLREHRGREVAEVEVLLADARLPAKFYDLPGYGSPNPVHDLIVRAAMADADCFMYVSHASRTLSERDLDLIRFLYEHYLLSGKRVVWVVTAIDSASNLDLNDVVEWKATIARNNSYLKENFTLPDGQPDLGFIGEGFIPVSPALEARAAKLEAEEAESPARRYRAESRMDTLRQAIEDLIRTGTGTRHIAAVAAEARVLLVPRLRVIEDRLRAERLEIDGLKELLDGHQRRLELLDRVLPELRDQLERKLQARVGRAVRPFGRLASHLHGALDSTIRRTDVSKGAKAHQVEMSKAQALRTWMEAPAGPATLWTEQFGAFKQDVAQAVEHAFGDKDLTGRLPDSVFDVNDLSLPRRAQRAATAQDTVQRAAALVGLVAPIAAGGTYFYGLAAAGTVFPPAGVVAGVAGMVFMGIEYRKRKLNSLQVLQEEWIGAIDTEVQAVKEQFALSAAVQGTDVIDHLSDNLAQYREQLESTRDFVRQRIANPENQVRQGLIDQLEPVDEEGRALVGALRKLEKP